MRRVSAPAGARERALAALLVGPNLALLAVFTLWPLLQNALLSLTSWDMISPERTWVGLANYRDVLGDPEFARIVLNTAVFTAATLAGTLGLGLALALLLNRPLHGRNAARAALFAPTLVSGAAVAVVWIYIFDPRYGLLRLLLEPLGLAAPAWLTDPAWAMPAVIIVYVWKNLGYAVVVFLAGLQAIPAELYEAARVDGAGPWHRFRHVTLPGLGPVTFFLVVTSVLSSFQAFDIIQVMTRGGPVNATNTLVYHLYESGFVAFQAGRAGVVAVLLFAAMLVLTLLQLRHLEHRVHYGGGAGV